MRSVALFRRPGAVLVTCSVAVTTVLALGTGGTASAAGRAAAADVAPGAPGAPSYFDLARKDCVGTATGTRSKVWYTVAGGALSDVYEPSSDIHHKTGLTCTNTRQRGCQALSVAPGAS